MVTMIVDYRQLEVVSTTHGVQITITDERNSKTTVINFSKAEALTFATALKGQAK